MPDEIGISVFILFPAPNSMSVYVPKWDKNKIGQKVPIWL